MQLYGNGVTKNFLSILESDLQRSRKTVTRLLALLLLLALVGVPALHRDLWLGALTLAAALAAGLLLGLGWGHFVNTYQYQRSIREHWNRWMRFSISCVSVRECYRKVHGRSPARSPWLLGLCLTALILAHLGLGLLALSENAGWWQIAPLFVLDAILIGFVVGVRWRERAWYRAFLKSVNELLAEGTIGVWGVY